MRLIDEHSAETYLRDMERIPPDEPIVVRELSGGVSNMVLAVQRPADPANSFVLKQARSQLRTAQPWFASVERIWREAEVLGICATILSAAHPSDGKAMQARTPRILFEDRDNYLLAMEMAPGASVVWKSQLLAGQLDPRVAAACGLLLGRLHAGSWLDQDIARRIGDRTLFDQLRVDPYYRTLAAARPDAREAVSQLVDSLAAHPRSLVHADFSPKNLLVSAYGLMMVDFETGHYGDPAFDLGFFLSHLVLKACFKIPRHADYLNLSLVFWESYCDTVGDTIGPRELADLRVRGILNFAGCGWARLDGKSPVEYLQDATRREQVRLVCREVFAARPSDWPDVIEMALRHFG